MARPAKNNCDYFPHDAGMRNHKKVKALRSKFGVTGYAVWSLLLEYITGSDGNVFPYTDLEFELMSGDFGVSATEIRSVVDYCILLELLFNKNGFINSDSLDERLAPVYEKRGKAKELSKKQLRDKGKFVSSNTDSTAVSVTEMPQSKVKESKGKKIKENNYVAIAPDWFDEKLIIAWNDWLKHRKELKKKMTESTAKKQIEFLRARGPDAVAIINQAIEKGWTGLYELQNKQTNGIHSRSNQGASGQVRTPDTRTIDYEAESSFK